MTSNEGTSIIKQASDALKVLSDSIWTKSHPIKPEIKDGFMRAPQTHLDEIAQDLEKSMPGMTVKHVTVQFVSGLPTELNEINGMEIQPNFSRLLGAPVAVTSIIAQSKANPKLLFDLHRGTLRLEDLAISNGRLPSLGWTELKSLKEISPVAAGSAKASTIDYYTKAAGIDQETSTPSISIRRQKEEAFEKLNDGSYFLSMGHSAGGAVSLLSAIHANGFKNPKSGIKKFKDVNHVGVASIAIADETALNDIQDKGIKCVQVTEPVGWANGIRGPASLLTGTGSAWFDTLKPRAAREQQESPCQMAGPVYVASPPDGSYNLPSAHYMSTLNQDIQKPGGLSGFKTANGKKLSDLESSWNAN